MRGLYKGADDLICARGGGLCARGGSFGTGRWPSEMACFAGAKTFLRKIENFRDGAESDGVFCVRESVLSGARWSENQRFRWCYRK